MMQDFDNINNNEETGGSLADSSSAAEILKKRGKLAQSEKDKISDIDGIYLFPFLLFNRNAI